MLKDKNIIILIILTCASQVLYLISEYYFTGGQLGFPLDDSWIHLRFADTFRQGYFFHYNLGEPTAGTTSPLWVVLVSGVSFIIPSLYFDALFLSFISFLFVVIYSYKLFQYSFEKLGFDNSKFLTFFASLLVVFSGRLNWAALSGMETNLFCLFCLMGVYYFLTNPGNKILIFIFLGLASATRPEGYLFSLIIVGYILIKEKSISKSFIQGILIYLILATPYLIFSYIVRGNILPNTFEGHGGGRSYFPSFNYLRIIGQYFFRDNAILGLLWLTGFILYIVNYKKFREKLGNLNLVFIWVYLLPLVYAAAIPNWRHHVRYLIPLIPFFVLVSIITLKFLSTLLISLKQNKFTNFLNSKTIYYIILFFSLPYYFVYMVYIGMNTDNINDQQVTLAKWVKENVPVENSIAINDIGAIKYFNGNKIIDMEGLVNSDILRYRRYDIDTRLDSTLSLLKRNNVTHMIIYDDWYREFINKYNKNLEFITSAKLEKNTICGGDEMKVYRIKYNN